LLNENDCVRAVLSKELCTGCGTCAAICPQKAIEMNLNMRQGLYIPNINNNICKNCGLCFKVCPGVTTNYGELNKVFFNNSRANIWLGNYKACYVGHAADQQLRYKSSSGGIISSLLIYALEKGFIDGALVTKMDKENPLIPVPFIAKTKDEVIAASGSKYCPVPANVALDYVIKNKGRYAAVGLPCHVNGLRKAMIQHKGLKEKIVLIIGLFCSHSDTFKAAKYILKACNLTLDDVESIKFRGDGWPGELQIVTKGGCSFSYDYEDYMSIMHQYNFFTPKRCFLCCDLTAEFADISCGDAWLTEYKSDKIGKSMIIVRTTNGKKIVNEALNDLVIELDKIDGKKVIEAQSIRFKKIYSRKKAHINEGAELFKPTLLDYIRRLDQGIAQLVGMYPSNLAIKIYLVIKRIADHVYLKFYKKNRNS